MSDKRYEANIIRTTAVEPANNIETTSAPGVWSLDEVMELQKKNKWPTVGNVTTDVDDVFSTFVYSGNSDTQTIDNGIALADGLGGGTSTQFGTGDYLSKLFSAGQLAADSKTFTLSVWFYWTGSTSQTIFDVPVFNVQCNVPAGNIITISGFSDSYATILGFSSTNKVVKNQWNHLLVSMDLSDSSKRHVYLNDASYAGSYTTYNNTNIGFGEAGTTTISSSSATFHGRLAHLFFDTTYRDFSVTSNRRTFIDANGGSTSVSTLTALNPPIYFPMTTGYSVGENEGTAGDFTVNGSPTIVSYGTVYQSNYGQGGMIWIKSRTNPGSGHFHHLVDSVRGQSSGFYKALYTNTDNPENQYPSSSNGGVSSFNSSGFTVAKGSNSNYFLNLTNYDYVSWTWRKAAGFFDIQSWTGTGSARTISHNLGSVPGAIIVKRSSATEDWNMFHRSLGNTKYLQMNGTGQAGTSGTSGGQANLWNNTDPTSTEFSIGTHDRVNTNGETYIAYIFAHHNNDGEFGPTASDDIIKCGSYNGNGQSAGVSVDLGFEPQWVFLRRSDASGWYAPIIDDIRGMVSGQNDAIIYANDPGAESSTNSIEPTATGFKAVDTSNSNVNGSTWVYIAIRKGPLATPTAALDVFDVQTYTGQNSAGYKITTNFVMDANITQGRDGKPACLGARLIDGMHETSSTAVNYTGLVDWINYDHNDGFDIGNYAYNNNNGVSYVSVSWKRAPSYFDVVPYQGTGSAGFTFNHNLGVKPEMIWVKNIGASEYWAVYHKDLNGGTNPSHYFLKLNGTDAETDYNEIWNDTEPTATQVTVGQQGVVNSSSYSHIAYLFATVAGVSKVGSYTGNGSTQNIDCGFTSGARFVLIKKISATGHWVYFDSARGIVAGNDPRLKLNNQDAEVTSYDDIDTYSAGFTLNNVALCNTNGASYIFYAVA